MATRIEVQAIDPVIFPFSTAPKPEPLPFVLKAFETMGLSPIKALDAPRVTDMKIQHHYHPFALFLVPGAVPYAVELTKSKKPDASFHFFEFTQQLAVGVDCEGMGKIWSRDTHKAAVDFQLNEPVRHLYLHNERIVVFTGNDVLQVFNSEGKQLFSCHCFQSNESRKKGERVPLAFYHNSVVVGTVVGFQILDLETGAVYKDQGGPIRSLAVVGDQLFVTLESEEVKLFNLRLNRWENLQIELETARFLASEGTKLASVSPNGTLVVRDLTTGGRLDIGKLPVAEILDLYFEGGFLVLRGAVVAESLLKCYQAEFILIDAQGQIQKVSSRRHNLSENPYDTHVERMRIGEGKAYVMNLDCEVDEFPLIFGAKNS